VKFDLYKSDVQVELNYAKVLFNQE